jgi:hypothetical protein
LGLFHHDQSAGQQCLGHLHLESGEDWVGLTFEARDRRPHEVVVFRSEVGFPDASLDPAADARQTLVYRGTDLHSRVKDDGLAEGAHYFYSIFAAGEDGQWHLQLQAEVTLRGGRHSSSHETEFDITATELARCPHCHGTGSGRTPRKLIPLPCPVCHGKGWVRVKQDVGVSQSTHAKAADVVSEPPSTTRESSGEIPLDEHTASGTGVAPSAPTAPTAPKGMDEVS